MKKTSYLYLILVFILSSALLLTSCTESTEQDETTRTADTSTEAEVETTIETDTEANSEVEVGVNYTQGNWVYTITEEGTATVLWGDGSEKSENVVMIPAELNGYTVATLGDGEQNVLSNNKVSNNFVLIPTSVINVSARAVYDYNDTAGWVFPSSITSILENSLLSCQGGTYYVEENSASQEYVEAADKTLEYLEQGSYNIFTVTAGENGYVQPNGTYYLPKAMLDGSYSKNILISSDIGYKIASVTIDGESYDFLQGEAKQNEITISYNFDQNSSEISVTFEEDPEDTRTADTSASSYEAPEVNMDAVTDGAELPGDVYTYQAVNTGTTTKYENTVGISTGKYYAADDTLYEMVYSSQKSEEPEYYSKAEAINGVYEAEGLVYGQDYDLVRLYNYYEEVSSGPAQGTVALYCTYLYKEISEDEVDLDSFGVVDVDNSYTNTAAIFVQEGADLTVTDLTADVYTSSRGPSEAGNFFGLGSAIHVDGGDATTPATNTVNEDTAYLKLITPRILGTVNSIYSLASGVLDIEGGDVFSCSSGGHGPYVSTGGQIYINTEDTNLVSDEGTINTDSSTLTATTRPSSDLGSMTRNEDGDMEGVFGEHEDDVTVIVTGDEAGTALATDTGGGVIVANQVTTMTYGLRCAGVYSIGFNESWVYCYNSTLTAALDAGLCSASGGYIYAYNSDITGVMGIKTRAGGNTDSDETGVIVENSRISAYYDDEEMIEAYDVASPDDWDDSMAEQGTGSNQLNIFLDKANDPSFYEDSLEWWFTDKSKTPGYSGGNKFAVIYVENSATPVYVTSTLLINQNYEEYGTLSDEAIAEGQTPADNLLISVESGGTGNVYFTDENSSTQWDLTGERTQTCELVGDFYIGEGTESSDNPNLGSGSNTLNAYFTNSEWEGTVLCADNSGVTNLTFDADSVWTVTSDATVNNITMDSEDCIVADEAVTITIAGTLTINNQEISEDYTVGNVTYVFDAEAINIIEASNMGGMAPEGMESAEGMEMPEGMEPPEGMEMPDGEGDAPQGGEGGTPPDGEGGAPQGGEDGTPPDGEGGTPPSSESES